MNPLILGALLLLAVSFNYFRIRRDLPIDLWWVHTAIINALFMLVFLEQRFKAGGIIYMGGCVLGALFIWLMARNFRQNPESSFGHFHYIPLYRNAMEFFALITGGLFVLSQFLWTLQAFRRGHFL